MKTAALLIALACLAGCRQVPTDTLENGNGDPVRYEALLTEARQHFADPRTIERVTRSAELFANALALRSDDYEALWQAARAAAWIGEYGLDDELREHHVRKGVTYANTSLQVNPEGVEARFYHGVLSGLLGELDNSYGPDAVKQIESRMTGLIDRGADIAHAGPLRVYGVLLLRAPGPPASIGSLRNARKQLQAAVEQAPGWPENQLYLAEWEFAWAGDKDNPEFAKQARERLENYLLGPEATAPANATYEFGVWQGRARKLLSDNE